MAGDDTPGPAGHFASLYARWRQPLRRMLAKYFKTPADIEDASQEVLVRMMAADKRLPADEERPYLYQVVRSVAAFEQRKAPRHAGVRVVSVEDCRNEVEAVPARNAEDGAMEAERRQRLTRLRDALGELPARQREAFVLHRVQELTLEQTAERMGITERMVSRHLARALSYCEMRVRYASAEQMRVLMDAGGGDADAAESTR
ncbi:MAG: RNA polymerase sigma factor [Burkholderiaceae bacterium]|jgi:RNA polymerase sigma-70 factor (ECF subfamily)|nr:RNA polymerase sigma factor [Burkholderiaceae bacterium]